MEKVVVAGSRPRRELLGGEALAQAMCSEGPGDDGQHSRNRCDRDPHTRSSPHTISDALHAVSADSTPKKAVVSLGPSC